MGRYGLIGEKLEHSYSARLHGLLGEYPYELIPLRPCELEGFLQKGDFDGLNVTLPYKKAVIPYCATLSETAKRIGSVNTIVKNKNGTLYGENTDAYGFAEMARRAAIGWKGKKVLVLGSGGTSLTVCAVVLEAGGTPVVVSRQGEVCYENLGSHTDAAVIVNTTPVGMYPETQESPVDLRRFPKLAGVLDVIYNPLRTKWLQQAKALSIPYAGGLTMLVMQAVGACELFTGKPVPEHRIQSALNTLQQERTNVVFVGMPGSGKTTIGARVAELLQLPLVDIDAEIEKACGCTIAELFAQRGEAHFRELEAAKIRQYGKEGGRVLAVGGGAVLSAENRENLCLNSFVIHLVRPLEQLSTQGRPLSKGREALQQLWKERAPLYAACADVTIENNGTPEACAQTIKEVYDEALGH